MQAYTPAADEYIKIRKNHTKLLEYLTVDTYFLSILLSMGLIQEYEHERIESRTVSIEKADGLLSIILQKCRMGQRPYSSLIKALVKGRQEHVKELLENCPVTTSDYTNFKDAFHTKSETTTSTRNSREVQTTNQHLLRKKNHKKVAKDKPLQQHTGSGFETDDTQCQDSHDNQSETYTDTQPINHVGNYTRQNVSNTQQGQKTAPHAGNYTGQNVSNTQQGQNTAPLAGNYTGQNVSNTQQGQNTAPHAGNYTGQNVSNTQQGQNTAPHATYHTPGQVIHPNYQSQGQIPYQGHGQFSPSNHQPNAQVNQFYGYVPEQTIHLNYHSQGQIPYQSQFNNKTYHSHAQMNHINATVSGQAIQPNNQVQSYNATQPMLSNDNPYGYGAHIPSTSQTQPGLQPETGVQNMSDGMILGPKAFTLMSSNIHGSSETLYAWMNSDEAKHTTNRRFSHGIDYSKLPLLNEPIYEALPSTYVAFTDLQAKDKKRKKKDKRKSSIDSTNTIKEQSLMIRDGEANEELDSVGTIDEIYTTSAAVASVICKDYTGKFAKNKKTKRIKEQLNGVDIELSSRNVRNGGARINRSTADSDKRRICSTCCTLL